MKLIEDWKKDREVKQHVIAATNKEIMNESAEYSVEDLHKMMDMNRKVKLNGVEAGDVLKVIANVAIVAVLVGFEMRNILNAKGSRFLKVL